jgi:ribonuclease E
MTKRMLIDATHAEETRVVVLDGNRLEDFDVETSTKKQLKGNIYLAKVVRVEPSLQAAFVEYGGGRHGFLAFSEIHPDYYQIPVADRQRLLEMQAQEAREEAEAEEEEAAREAEQSRRQGHHRHAAPVEPAPADEPAGETVVGEVPEGAPTSADAAEEAVAEHEAAEPTADVRFDTAGEPAADEGPRPAQPARIESDQRFGPVTDDAAAEPASASGSGTTEHLPAPVEAEDASAPQAEAAPAVDDEAPESGDFAHGDVEGPPPDLPPPETVGGEGDGGDGAEEARQRRASRILRNYRIQEVIRRRQILLVQVVKEERGTKGAALTTYISLAGRYCVLMPNSPRGGGISRKITSAADRRRLKEITAELDIPDGMGLIVRTAGANRPKPEIKRDCEYLMRLWDDIREHTLRSVAPTLIYEEASLIKRAIRDVYSRDIDEVTVDGEEGWKQAHEFMRMLMPSHAKKVQLWRGGAGPGVPPQPLFSKYQVEAQLDAMLGSTVPLKSGGYLVINQAEALVAIDVNSGRATRERGIEETALRTNLEAADEVARQLRLRDLAGLIVIDFIDMESKKNNAAVERRMKEALKNDRARIQVGHISHFGLLEMSRQRLRPSLAETSLMPCPHCAGTGHVRSTESSAIHVLRAIEEEGAKGRASLIRLQVATSVVLYLFNHKRDRLADIEARYAMRVQFESDDTLLPPQVRIERLRPQVPEAERAAYAVTGGAPVASTAVVAPLAPALPATDDDEDDVSESETDVGDVEEARSSTPEGALRAGAESEERRRRRRRRRRGGRRDQPGAAGGAQADVSVDAVEGVESFDEIESDEEETVAPAAEAEVAIEPAEQSQAEQPSGDLEEAESGRSRRRGRRGGRRKRRGETPAGEEGEVRVEAESETDEVAEPAPRSRGGARPARPPAYTGPTPADPFGGAPFDIFDILDQPTPPSAPAAAALPAPAPAPVESAPEPEAPAETATSVEVDATAAAVEPTPEPETAAAPASEAEPLVKPIVIGVESSPPAERKRGWWRR